MSLLHPSKNAIRILTCVGVFLCATLVIVGTLAALYETATVVRVYGGLTAAAALIVGAVISRPFWPQVEAVPDRSMPPPSR